jgi:hypothetical protein
MAASERKLGKAMYADWIWSGGTVQVTGDQTTLDLSRAVSTVNAAAGSETSEYAKATLKNYGVSGELYFKGTAGTAVLAALAESNEGTLRWGAMGSASGMPKGQLAAVVTKQDIKHPFDNLIVVSVEWAGQGPLISDPNSATW